MDLSGLRQTPATKALLLAAGAFVVALVTRRIWLRILGPVFAYEAMRLSRHRKTIALRSIYAALLLTILFVVVPPTAAANEDALTHLADEFCRAFLVAQAAAVLLLTPVYMAGAICDEKENRSLDFLICTPLSSREIVLGKLAARLLNVFALLLAGLPVLALTQLWGGVDLTRLLTGFATTAVAALSLGSFAVFCSVIARKTTQALVTVYAAVAAVNLIAFCMPFGHLLSPLVFALDSDSFGASEIPLFVILHVLFSTTCLGMAVALLRLNAGPPEPVRDPLLDVIPPRFDADGRRIPPVLTQRDLTPPATLALPPINENRPLLWKETFVARSAHDTMLADTAWMCFGIFVALAGLFFLLFGPIPWSDWPQAVVLGFAILPASALILGVGYRLAAGVTDEREARTLQCLLVLPGSRTHILAAKWLGAVRRANRPLMALSLTLIMGVIGKALHPFSAALVFTAIVIHTVFWATFALFLSAVCRSTVQARLILFGTFLALTIGTWLGDMYATTNLAIEPTWPALVYDGFNPIRSIKLLTFGRIDTIAAPLSPTRVALVSGLSAYTIMSAILWLCTVYRFRRETV